MKNFEAIIAAMLKDWDLDLYTRWFEYVETEEEYMDEVNISIEENVWGIRDISETWEEDFTKALEEALGGDVDVYISVN